MKSKKKYDHPFVFSEQVFVVARIERRKGPREGQEYDHGDSAAFHKVMKQRYWFRIEHEEPKPAIFLGYRTLAEGTTEFEVDPEAGGGDIYFDVDNHIRGAWICRPGFNPEKVFLDDVKPRCSFGLGTLDHSDQCKNIATFRHTPESYLEKIGLKKAPRKILQEEVDSLGKWCAKHQLGGMVPIEPNRIST